METMARIFKPHVDLPLRPYGGPLRRIPQSWVLVASSRARRNPPPALTRPHVNGHSEREGRTSKRLYSSIPAPLSSLPISMRILRLILFIYWHARPPVSDISSPPGSYQPSIRLGPQGGDTAAQIQLRDVSDTVESESTCHEEVAQIDSEWECRKGAPLVPTTGISPAQSPDTCSSPILSRCCPRPLRGRGDDDVAMDERTTTFERAVRCAGRPRCFAPAEPGAARLLTTAGSSKGTPL
ncbi:hypothetical protein B0H19DRAFT_1200439 [Mycena capillaripes]|nr:hypothetical protein B0H19DRAFT_1200439 [Mycena capillaripes]